MAEEILTKSFSQLLSLFPNSTPTKACFSSNTSESEDPTVSKFLSNLETSLISLNLPCSLTPNSLFIQIKAIITETPDNTAKINSSKLPSASLFTESQLKRLNLS